VPRASGYYATGSGAWGEPSDPTATESLVRSNAWSSSSMSMAASESVGNADDGGASLPLSRAPSDGEADSDAVGTGAAEPGVSHAMQVCLPHNADAQRTPPD
jgi:hypothetical protein